MIEAQFQGRLGDFQLDATLSVPARGVTVLFGPSGSGKTTLLRCLAGLTRLPGRLSVSSEVWQDAARFLAPHRRRVGYVFQDAALFEHMDVRANLLYGRRRAGLGEGAEYDHVVGLLDLGGLLGRRPANLSGGERQRVAIGRALLRAPRLMLMDEPLAGLDAHRKGEVIPYLEALHAEAGVPIIYVTHDVAEAARLGDRLLPIQAGVISEAVELRGDFAGDRTWLFRRLEEIGAAALTREFILGGAAPEVAALAVEALAAPPTKAAALSPQSPRGERR